jgi:hypothetical protein
MQVPFTVQQFFGVIADYNRAVWPAPVVLQALAIVALALVVWPRRQSGVVISAILSVLWAWTGLAYHLAFFAAINPLAPVFAVASLSAAGVFLVEGAVRRRLEFRLAMNLRSMLGAGLVVFALLVYPVWTSMAGHPYPELPTFGLPCPTTLFTMGLLALLVAPYPRSPLVVPVAWCAVGAQAAILFGVRADLALLGAGALGVVQLLRAKSTASAAAAAS